MAIGLVPRVNKNNIAILQDSRLHITPPVKNNLAFYSSSSETGSYRDSRGYRMLREEAYKTQEGKNPSQ